MPDEARDAAFLWDIVHTARKAAASVKDIRLEDYLANEDLRLSVERRLEIIGEASRRLSQDFRDRRPGIR